MKICNLNQIKNDKNLRGVQTKKSYVLLFKRRPVGCVFYKPNYIFGLRERRHVCVSVILVNNNMHHKIIKVELAFWW